RLRQEVREKWPLRSLQNVAWSVADGGLRFAGAESQYSAIFLPSVFDRRRMYKFRFQEEMEGHLCSHSKSTLILYSEEETSSVFDPQKNPSLSIVCRSLHGQLTIRSQSRCTSNAKPS